MKIIAVANCTAAKTKTPSTPLRAATLERMPLPLVASEWRRRARNTSERVAVSSLYCGRGFNTAVDAATRYGASIHVLSAGFGVLALRDSIPSYSLTVTPDTKDFILARAADPAAVTSLDWWAALTGYDAIRSISDLVENNRSALILLGISSAYLEMISNELVGLPERDLDRLRIIGPKRCDHLTEVLRSLVMPYDDRLNGPDSEMRGTEFDFAQRALASFVRLIHRDKSIGTPEEHAKRVRLSLGQKRVSKKVKRKRITDESLLRHVRSIKKRSTSISAGLRTLRKERKIACEQNRFARSWARLEAE